MIKAKVLIILILGFAIPFTISKYFIDENQAKVNFSLKDRLKYIAIYIPFLLLAIGAIIYIQESS